MDNLAYYRIPVYVVTLVMHLTNVVYMDNNLKEGAAYHPKIKEMSSIPIGYFTFWNVFFQVLYASFGLYCDVQMIRKSGEIGKELASYIEFKKWIFGALVWPSGMSVYTLFWPIYWYDRYLVLPDYVDPYMSTYSNYVIHGFIVPILLWEMLLLPRTETATHTKNFVFLQGIHGLYLICLFYIKKTRDIWPYPILGQIEGSIRLPLFLFYIFCLVTFHYFTQWPIRRFVWGNTNAGKKTL